jgi:hypothetical protein
MNAQVAWNGEQLGGQPQEMLERLTAEVPISGSLATQRFEDLFECLCAKGILRV